MTLPLTRMLQMAFYNRWFDEFERGRREWRPYLSHRSRLPGRFYNVQPVITRPTRYAIIGASHVRRITEHLQKQRIYNYNLTRRLYDVVAFSEGGIRVCPDDKTPSDKRLGNYLDNAAVVKADVVVLLAGSNDVMAKNVSPMNIANALFGAAEYCLVAGARRVVICLLFPRKGKAFNEQMNAVTRAILRVVRSGGDGRIRYWRSKGLWGKPSSFICGDGTHLNKMGQEKLYRSLRGAIMKNYFRVRAY